jgi:hypothetical protein
MVVLHEYLMNNGVYFVLIQLDLCLHEWQVHCHRVIIFLEHLHDFLLELNDVLIDKIM